MLIRKDRAGSCSLGHVWHHDGAVVDVPEEHAGILLRIRDAGFSVVERLEHLLHHDQVAEPPADELVPAPLAQPEPAPAESAPASALTEPAPPAAVTESGTVAPRPSPPPVRSGRLGRA
jgi:hypothetical protein